MADITFYMILIPLVVATWLSVAVMGYLLYWVIKNGR